MTRPNPKITSDLRFKIEIWSFITLVSLALFLLPWLFFWFIFYFGLQLPALIAYLLIFAIAGISMKIFDNQLCEKIFTVIIGVGLYLLVYFLMMLWGSSIIPMKDM